MCTKKELPACPVETTLTMISDKWKVLILRDLLTGTKRFGELKKSLTGVSQKVLTSQLREMEENGLVERQLPYLRQHPAFFAKRRNCTMERILLLEDDKSLVTGLTLALGRAGYALDTARTLAEAGHLWQAGRYDLLMLDVTLPDGTGFDFCREVRRTSGVPILFLTASDEEMDIITGLDLGGDDYITKPFKLGVLLSRVHALLRRAGGFGAQQATELCSGGIRVDLLAGRAEKNGVPLELTAAEYKLLCLFLRSPGQVLTKETILNALWDCEGNYVDTNTLTVYIRRLRLKVEDDPGSPQRLVTVRGMGYRWNGDV